MFNFLKKLAEDLIKIKEKMSLEKQIKQDENKKILAKTLEKLKEQYTDVYLYPFSPDYAYSNAYAYEFLKNKDESPIYKYTFHIYKSDLFKTKKKIGAFWNKKSFHKFEVDDIIPNNNSRVVNDIINNSPVVNDIVFNNSFSLIDQIMFKQADRYYLEESGELFFFSKRKDFSQKCSFGEFSWNLEYDQWGRRRKNVPFIKSFKGWVRG